MYIIFLQKSICLHDIFLYFIIVAFFCQFEFCESRFDQLLCIPFDCVVLFCFLMRFVHTHTHSLSCDANCIFLHVLKSVCVQYFSELRLFVEGNLPVFVERESL